MKKKAVIIGSGFAGLSAACFLAKENWQVQVVDNNSMPGGRAKQLNENGFTFDMGPSWYWMPDIFERFFSLFNKHPGDYYQLQRLNPSYRIYWENEQRNFPADFESLKQMAEQMESGSAAKLEKFLHEAAVKYKISMKNLVFKPGLSLTEFADMNLLKSMFQLNLFSSVQKYVNKLFNSEQLRQWLTFPVLFLGAMPNKIPALYTLMNYADIHGGTWYPQGGMYSVVKAMHSLALEYGVEFFFDETVEEINIHNNTVQSVTTQKNILQANAVVGSADYHHIENKLLNKKYRNYTQQYWNSRVMAPSCLLYFVGLNKKLKNITHHSLFFDAPFEAHGKEIYETKQWPGNPMFYACVSSVTDSTVAPPGCENIFLLIPVAAGLTDDTPELRERYFENIISRMEKQTGQSIRESIIYKKSFATSNFIEDYHSYKGNAYGLANTLRQTAFLKPSCRNKKVSNLFYAGQLTVPGPGVPPAIISGEIAARQIIKSFKTK